MKAASQRPDLRDRSKDSYALDTQIGFRLRVALQQHTDVFFNTMDFGLTQAQFALIVRLYEYGPCSQNRLGRLAALDSASIVGVIGRLRAKRLISTGKSSNDRRRVVVQLTQEGRQLVRKAIPLGQKANEETLSALNPEQRGKLLELLWILGSSELAPNPSDPVSASERSAS